MALNATDINKLVSEEPCKKQIEKWQALFNYTYVEASTKIAQHNANVSRRRVLDELWELVKPKKEAQGYDRSAYEHELEASSRTAGSEQSVQKRPAVLTAAQARESYIVKLDGPFSTATKIQAAAGLAEPPAVVAGEGSNGAASFCRIDGAARQRLLDWLSAAEKTSFEPTFARITGRSAKDFDTHTLYPSLGIDITLPQYRASSSNNDATTAVLPTQQQYPVWYFFYGNLANRSILSRRLRVAETDAESLVLKPASVMRGRLGTWAGTYKALIDGPPSARVAGWAFLVRDEECEDALRAYETDHYEVVRCVIALDGMQVPGCVFRFVDQAAVELG